MDSEYGYLPSVGHIRPLRFLSPGTTSTRPFRQGAPPPATTPYPHPITTPWQPRPLCRPRAAGVQRSVLGFGAPSTALLEGGWQRMRKLTSTSASAARGRLAAHAQTDKHQWRPLLEGDCRRGFITCKGRSEPLGHSPAQELGCPRAAGRHCCVWCGEG